MQPSDARMTARTRAERTEQSRYSALVLVFSGTLLLSALLLFSIQPLFAKMILPRLGGTPAVWSIAMVFFQGVLLAGYTYAHFLVRHAGPRRAFAIHAAVMGLALLWLPIAAASGFDAPPATGQPLWLLCLFAASVGVPFFAVSANAPLLQAWFSRTNHPHAADPYFLYGASNIGSFAALLSYPVLFEPLFGLSEQAQLWTAGYLMLLAGLVACGMLAIAGGQAGRTMAAAPADLADAAGWRQRLGWMGLAFLPSALLVAVTAHLSTNIAAAPFLWVMPLAVFLLTFVITFSRRPLVPARTAQLLLPAVVLGALVTYWRPLEIAGTVAIAINLFALFVVAIVWHSRLVASRPAAAHLTDFYLCISAGGVLGGAFTSLAAPVLFQTVAEFPLLLVLSLLGLPEVRSIIRKPAGGIAAGTLIALLVSWVSLFSDVEYRDRNFFGVITTRILDDGRFRALLHGTTLHGAEHMADFAEEARGTARPEPLTYYSRGGPLAAGIAHERARKGALSVGIVGLGTGALACYSAPGDDWTFYEIDPAVIRIARDSRYFKFLASCAPGAGISQGDARLNLASEPDGRFDVLVIDAFSSDAIPVHLLTQEALRLYGRKTAADGVILLHISNNFVELGSVVAAGAAAESMAAVRLFHTWPTAEFGNRMATASDVVALSRRPESLQPYLDTGWQDLEPFAGVQAWTDDYSNVVGAILRRQGLLPSPAMPASP
jgi:hypothetical protein